MKRPIVLSALLALALCACGLPSFAQGRPAGKGPSGPPSGSPGGASSSNPGSAARGSSGAPGSTHAGPNANTGKRSIDDLLKQNTKLSSKISGLTGTSAQKACAGFKNLGQCVAAAHVSKNLGIDFNTLKGKVTGTGSESLGKAIHDLNPNVDAKAEAKKAEKQSHDDLNESSS
jgi:hypothetical protein